MSYSTLYYSVKIDHWDTLNAVYAEIKEIAEEVRKEYRRKSPSLSCLLVTRPIKQVINPLSMLIQHRYSDDATLNLISSAIKRLHCIAFDLEQNYETRFVDKLRSLADILFSFVGDNQPIQLELFDKNQYHEPHWKSRVFAHLNRWWNHRFRNKLGFSTHPKCDPIRFTQFTIDLWKPQLESNKKRYFNAYFEVSESESENLFFSQLSLRQLRRVASLLGMPQKVGGKDRSKESFVTELESLMATDRQRLVNTIKMVTENV